MTGLTAFPTTSLDGLPATGTVPLVGQVPVYSGSSWAYAYAPGKEWASVTSNSTLTTASTTAVQLLAFPAATYDGAPVWFQFAASVVTNGAGNVTRFWFGEGGVAISNVYFCYPVSSSVGAPITMFFRYTPSAAAHTFQILWASTTSGTSGIDAANLTTPYARITKV